MSVELTRELLSFVNSSPSAFHTVLNIEMMLKEDGYKELCESEAWDIDFKGKYYEKRNDTSIIAFHVGENLTGYSFNIAASHSDYPTFKIKEKPELKVILWLIRRSFFVLLPPSLIFCQ